MRAAEAETVPIGLSVRERIRERLTRHVRKSVEKLAVGRPLSKEEAQAARKTDSVRNSKSLEKKRKQVQV
jgi:hypothetical protein